MFGAPFLSPALPFYLRAMSASYPALRMRRGRSSAWMRSMLAENRLHPSDFILPLFICEGSGCEEPIGFAPGRQPLERRPHHRQGEGSGEPRHPVRRAVSEYAE